jgi:uncharacterized low-complexity protein
MKNKKSILSGAVLAAAVLTAGAGSLEANNFQFDELGSGAELRSMLLDNSMNVQFSNFIELKCSAGAEKSDSKAATKDAKAKDAKATDGKCGEGKCGEGKCGEKKDAKGTKAEKKAAAKEAKAADHKCGEGKCGDKKETPKK